MSAKNYFLIIAPDRVGVMEVRTTHRDDHMQSPLIQSGASRVGGLLLEQDSVSTDADVYARSQGSFIIAQAEDIDAVWELVKADAFWQRDVWDKERVTVVPVFVARPQLK